MKKIALAAVPAAVLIAAFLFAACMVGPGYRGDVVVAPALPSVVILEDEPYYYYGGYYYFYEGDRWRYSNSRGGPWRDLPRDRYPGEVRFKHRDRDRDEDRGRGERRERDEGDRR